MILKDIKDMERFLAYDCYCPGEIYDSTGIFFEVYKPEQECKLMKDSEDFIGVICENQILLLPKKDDKILDAIRYDATENNIKEITKFLNGVREGLHVDEFKKDSKRKSLEKLASICDGIMV